MIDPSIQQELEAILAALNTHSLFSGLGFLVGQGDRQPRRRQTASLLPLTACFSVATSRVWPVLSEETELC